MRCDSEKKTVRIEEKNAFGQFVHDQLNTGWEENGKLWTRIKIINYPLNGL